MLLCEHRINVNYNGIISVPSPKFTVGSPNEQVSYCHQEPRTGKKKLFKMYRSLNAITFEFCSAEAAGRSQQFHPSSSAIARNTERL